VAILSPDHGEHQLKEFKSWHDINDIAEENFIICPSVAGNLYQHGLTLVDWNLKHVHINSARSDDSSRCFAD
jgi:hypothetical protein